MHRPCSGCACETLVRLGCLKQPGGERRWEQTFYEAIAASTTCEEGPVCLLLFFSLIHCQLLVL